MPPLTDSATLAGLYQDHHRWLREWLHRKLRCSHKAADLAQDTFLRLLTSRDALLGIHNPRGLLTTTARRLMIDRARREILERTFMAELAVQAEDNHFCGSPEQLWQALEALEQISRVLERVPARARQAFLLHYLDGWPQADIAAELQVTSRTIRNDLALVLVRCQEFAPGS